MYIGLAVRIDMSDEFINIGGVIAPDSRFTEDAAGNPVEVRLEEDGTTVRTVE